MRTDNYTFFRKQIEDDIKNIVTDWEYVDKRLCKEHFGFNYWILSRLFSVDEEIIQNLITEYNDKAIDCYVHFPENKELFIIQNKYYDGASISRSDVADF